jgi:hypothetical protein
MKKLTTGLSKKAGIFLSLFIWLSLTLAGGAWLQWKNHPWELQPRPPSEKTKTLSVFFLKQDGIYQVTAESAEAKRLPIEATLTVKNGLTPLAPFVIGGLNQTKLYFFQTTDEKKYTALHVYDLETQQESEIAASQDQEEFRDLTLSPDGSRLAYIYGERNFSEVNQEGSEDIVIRDTQSGEVVDTYTRKYDFTSLNLKGWLDRNNLVFSTGWEGEGYYQYEVGSHTASEDLPTLGSSGMGGLERVVLQNDLGQYGFINNWNQEIVGDNMAADGAFFRTDSKATPQFLSNHEIIEMLPVGDQLYYLAQISERANEWQNYGVDVFRVDQNGVRTERLTQDGETGIKKQHLFVSLDGRFLTYDSYYSSDVLSEDPYSVFKANSSWVYDTQLGKAYKVSDQSLFPVLIWKQ